MLPMKSFVYYAMFLLLTSCVTINVYFPAAAADSAARTIVRDVLGENPAANTEDAKKPVDKGSSFDVRMTRWVSVFGELLNLVVPQAHANANININTPVINKLRASLKARQSKLQPFFNSGAVGLTKNGLVAVRKLGAIPLKQRNLVKKLVADENRDRNALYKEIAVANGHPEWASDIQKTFAKVWVQESPSGIWYEDSNGKWKQK